MGAILADTHSLVWFVFNPDKLSEPARASLRAADAILVSCMSLVEVCYLGEKGRVPAHYFGQLLDLFDDPTTGLRLVPIDEGVVRAIPGVPRAAVPDLPDRVIAATAVANGVPLVSRDGKIRASTVQTIW